MEQLCTLIAQAKAQDLLLQGKFILYSAFPLPTNSRVILKAVMKSTVKEEARMGASTRGSFREQIVIVFTCIH